MMIKQKRPGNFGKLRQEKVSKDKSVCFRKRPSFINETLHYEELSEEYLFNAKKRKRDEFENKSHLHKKRFDEDDESNEESTASHVGKDSTKTTGAAAE